MYTQIINLNQGVNLVSFFINTPTILSNIQNMTTISTMNNNTIYSSISIAGNVIGTIQNTISGYGYFITCSSPSSIQINSNTLQTTTINLNEGIKFKL